MSPRAKEELRPKVPRVAFRNHAKRRRPGDLHNILSFCQSNGISESMYYSLKRKGLGPREIELDGRILISEQAESDWRAERERETMAKRQGQPRLAAQAAGAGSTAQSG